MSKNKLHIKNIQVKKSPTLNKYISEKTQKILKMSMSVDLTFLIKKEGSGIAIRCEVDLAGSGFVIRSSKTNPYEVIDDLVAKISHKIDRFHSQEYSTPESKLPEVIKNIPEYTVNVNYFEKEYLDNIIVEEKKEDISVMSRAEAIDLLELTKRDFLIFREIGDKGELKIIYRKSKDSLEYGITIAKTV